MLQQQQNVVVAEQQIQIAQQTVAKCPSEWDLRRLVRGNVSAAKKERLEEHLLECRECWESFASLGGHDHQ